MGKKEKKGYNKIKVFASGILCGAIILVVSSNHIQITDKDKENDNSSFQIPEFGESFIVEKEAEEYTHSYYGIVQSHYGDKVKVHVFEDGENKIVSGASATTEVDNYSYLASSYVSEKEVILYTALQNKDDNNYFKSEYDVYLFCELMKDVYEEYLKREDFETLEERKNILYTNFTNYVAKNSSYTIGGKKFSELKTTVQKDIIKVYKQIFNMHFGNEIKEESILEQFMAKQEKIIKYEILKRFKHKVRN